MDSVLIKFDNDATYDFNLKAFIPLRGRTGLYFIFLQKLSISYPFKSSKLIYIGMSESRVNSIGKRLRDHLTGESKNKGISGYNNKWKLRFVHLDYEFLKHLFPGNGIEFIEAVFLENFVNSYGSYPICNNRRGSNEYLKSFIFADSANIDWNYFEDKNDG